MKFAKILILSSAVAAFAFPILSKAQNASKGMTGVMDHGGEIGVVDHDSSKSNKSRAQVKQELQDAHNNGSHEMGGEASTVKPVPAGAGKSRQEVKNEMINISPEEKKRLKETYLGGN